MHALRTFFSHRNLPAITSSRKPIHSITSLYNKQKALQTVLTSPLKTSIKRNYSVIRHVFDGSLLTVGILIVSGYLYQSIYLPLKNRNNLTIIAKYGNEIEKMGALLEASEKSDLESTKLILQNYKPHKEVLKICFQRIVKSPSLPNKNTQRTICTLLEAGLKPNEAVLKYAIEHSYLDIIKICVNQEKLLLTKELIRLSLCHADAKTIDYLLKHVED
ncbi:hypothetical protein BN1013_01899 [Candidatus Rubidus massiliensis]|nr:hypothetical protein BN1013_01899 [Candidatus Rubidus massiliensis]